MSSKRHPGARWWKVDFHAHSPASFDYGGLEGRVTTTPRPSYKEWLQTYMDSNVDAIVIADHNSHEGIDPAREALAQLKAADSPTFRDLVILPGVEVTTNGGFHLLAVFHEDSASDVVNGLLHKAGYSGSRGGSDATTPTSFRDVVAHIDADGGLAIPAHIDGPKGLLGADSRDIDTIKQGGLIFAAEVTELDASSTISRSWIPVLGSDAHHLAAPEDDSIPNAKFPGSHFTWMKMGQPSLAGIRVALSDGVTSVRRSIEVSVDPNLYEHSMIDSMHISHGDDTFDYYLNPWLNAIIGGRGTGKSTVVEYLRLVLQRFDELPARMQKDFEWFTPNVRPASAARAWDASTLIRVIYTRDETRFRLTWKGADPHETIIECETEGAWERQDGEVQERFPVLINSQKQIYEMASDPQSLLKLIDQQPSIDKPMWQQNHDALVLQYRTQRAEIEEVEARVKDESRIRGNLADAESLVARLAALRDSPEARELDALRASSAHSIRIDQAGVQLEQGLRAAIEGLDLDLLEEVADSPWPAEQSRYIAVRDTYSVVSDSLNKLEQSRDAFSEAVQAGDPRAARMAELRQALNPQADSADAELSALQNASEDPHGLAISRRDVLMDDLARIERDKVRVASLLRVAEATLDAIRESRKLLTQRRSVAVTSMVSQDFKLKIAGQADESRLEFELRRITQRSTSFDSIFGPNGLTSLLGQYPFASTYIDSVDRVKDMLKHVHASTDERFNFPGYLGDHIDRRFIQHVQSLDGHQFHTDVDVWFPEDRLQVMYRQEGETSLKPLDEGSPGQKTAALLALVLQLGSQPLVLDQPEDDLDNRLIYDLIVSTLKRVKTKRQVLVVTHNANVVVNADAEYVAILEHGSLPILSLSGPIQDIDVRASICSIMEGGETAFSVRYKRLMPHLR